MLTSVEKRNAFWNSSIFIITQIINFINYTLNLKTFGFELLGNYLLISAILGIGSSIDFGFGISAVKHISEARKKNDLYSLNSIFVTFFIIFFVLAVINLSIYISYYFIFYKNTIKVDSNPTIDFKLIFFFLVISFFFSYMANYLRSVCEGFARFVSLAKILLFSSIVNLGFMIIIFIEKLNLESLAFFVLLGNFILFGVLFVYTSRFIPEIKFNLTYFNFRLIKKYSLYNLNLQLTFFIANFIDVIIKLYLGKYLSLSYVTFFESAKKIINFSNGLIQSAQKGLLNKLSEEMAVNNINKFIDEKLYLYSKMANYYSIILYGVINPFLCYFILYWFKSFETMIIFLIFLLPYTLINFCAPPYAVLMIEGKGLKLPLLQIINIVFTAFFLFVSLSLFGNYLGLVGYYFAIIINIYLVIYFLVKTYDMNYRKYFEKTKFKDIIKLSVIILSQYLLLFYCKQYYFYLLLLYLLVFSIVFREYVLYFSKLLLTRVKRLSFKY